METGSGREVTAKPRIPELFFPVVQGDQASLGPAGTVIFLPALQQLVLSLAPDKILAPRDSKRMMTGK